MLRSRSTGGRFTPSNVPDYASRPCKGISGFSIAGTLTGPATRSEGPTEVWGHSAQGVRVNSPWISSAGGARTAASLRAAPYAGPLPDSDSKATAPGGRRRPLRQLCLSIVMPRPFTAELDRSLAVRVPGQPCYTAPHAPRQPSAGEKKRIMGTETGPVMTW